VTDYKKNSTTWKDKTPETKKADPPKTEATPKADEKKD
jgi:hypothetical protein